jgi:tetratricopeptide (TPR) repeat protein
MKHRLLLLLAALLPVWVNAQAPASSPVNRRIELAEKKIRAEPKNAQAYNELAFALCRAARDREDLALYTRAHAALDHSLELSPNNYEAQKLRVTVLLGQHLSTEALKLATEVNRRMPDDIYGWGLLVDANVAVGNDAEAERAAQWILDLRPGSGLGFTKAAGLREKFGDPEGALEFLEEAERRVSPNDTDERVWLLIGKARLHLSMNDPVRARECLDQAGQLFPDSRLLLKSRAELLRKTTVQKAAGL